MKLGVYVGSFNPVHKGHIHVANYLLEKNIVDKVLLIPTEEYWHKTDLASIQDRINMLKNYETDKIIVDSVHNSKYTYKVLRNIKEDYNEELFLIIGSDNLERLNEWEKIEEIKENKIIVVKRGNKKIDIKEDNFIIINEFDNIDASSTEVRKGNTDLLDKPVYEYIKKRKLYNL